VQAVVARQGERVEVFAVEWRDDRLVEPVQRIVRQLVAVMLEPLQLVGDVPVGRLGGQQPDQGPGSLLYLLGYRDEVVEEPAVFREQTEWRHVVGLRRRSADPGIIVPGCAARLLIPCNK